MGLISVDSESDVQEDISSSLRTETDEEENEHKFSHNTSEESSVGGESLLHPEAVNLSKYVRVERKNRSGLLPDITVENADLSENRSGEDGHSGEGSDEEGSMQFARSHMSM